MVLKSLVLCLAALGSSLAFADGAATSFGGQMHDVKPVLATHGVNSECWLKGHQHTCKQCTDAGGALFDLPNNGGKICKFSGVAACSIKGSVGGFMWKQSENWSRTHSRTCTGTVSASCGSMPNSCNSYASVTTGQHTTFDNVDPVSESKVYVSYLPTSQAHTNNAATCWKQSCVVGAPNACPTGFGCVGSIPLNQNGCCLPTASIPACAGS